MVGWGQDLPGPDDPTPPDDPPDPGSGGGFTRLHVTFDSIRFLRDGELCRREFCDPDVELFHRVQNQSHFANIVDLDEDLSDGFIPQPVPNPVYSVAIPQGRDLRIYGRGVQDNYFENKIIGAHSRTFTPASNYGIGLKYTDEEFVNLPAASAGGENETAGNCVQPNPNCLA